MSIIMDYLLNEKQMTEAVAKRMEKKISKYDDICNEFMYWLEHRLFKTDQPLVVEGYNAQDIQKLAPFMDVLGIYNFMVTLRDDPEKAKEYIDSGFKRK